jgi:hypothetical protein
LDNEGELKTENTMTGWSILFWLIVSFVLLHPLSRWINAHVQGVTFLITRSPAVSMWIFWVLFLPGTLLHEISHWVTAKLLGVKTTRFSLWPQAKRGGELQMGAVQVDVPDPFRHSLIGLAPLIFGSLAVLLIGEWWLALSQIGIALATGDLELIIKAMGNVLNVPDVWLWLYLMFAISNTMLPSASDRLAWRAVLIYLGLALLLGIGLGLNPTFSPEIQKMGLTICTYLLSAFTITIAVDIFFVIIIFLIEILVSRMVGQQVQYMR